MASLSISNSTITYSYPVAFTPSKSNEKHLLKEVPKLEENPNDDQTDKDWEDWGRECLAIVQSMR